MDIDIAGATVQLAVTLAGAFLIAAVGWAVALWRASHRRDRKLDRLLVLFEGEPADPLADRPATVGVMGQLNQLAQRVTALEQAVRTSGGPRDPYTS